MPRSRTAGPLRVAGGRRSKMRFVPNRRDRGPPGPLADAPMLHPSLRTFAPATDLDPAFRVALRSGRLDQACVSVHPDLYLCRPFSQDWQRRLVEEVLHVSAWATREGRTVSPPNSMNRTGLVLADIGLGPALASAMRAVVSPLAARLFPEVGGESLDDAHAFTVSYRPDGDTGLGFHVDDSEVTLNLCLGHAFSGGDLYFAGRRCAAHRQTGCATADQRVHAHQPGVAVLHAGAHRHGALEITEGDRLNLILWCRSSRYRAWAAAQPGCPSWCARSRAR